MDREEAIEILENGEWWDELQEYYMIAHPEHDKLPEAVDMAVAALREQEERENPNPLTLDELKLHLSKRHPYEIEPLYIVFDPPFPIDYAPRWRDAYNLSSIVAHDAENYGKRWKAYRCKPKEGYDNDGKES